MSNFKFSKKSRLLNKADFEFLRTGSQRFYFDHIIFYYKKSRLPDSNSSRIGFSVSKKLGCAVSRNKVKRSLREEFRLSENRFSGHDILITMNFKKIGMKPLVDNNLIFAMRSELSLGLSKIALQNV